MLKEVQNLPDNWEKVSISDVLFFQEGPGVRKWQFTQEGVKLLNGGNINNNAINLDSTKIYISEEEAQGKYSHFMIDPGDLVIACSGIVVNKFKYKIAVIDQKHTPLCLNTSTMRFKSLGDIDLKYYAYFLQTKYFSKQLQRLITGSAQLNFGPSHIKKMEVLLPPLEEQKKIAAILDAADDYRQKTKSLTSKYDQLTQSLFLDMFGDPVTNPMGWDTQKLKNNVSIVSGFAFKSKLFNQEEQGMPIIRIRDVGKPKAKTFYSGDYKPDYLIHSGDLIIGMDGDFRLAEWKGGTALLNQRVCKINSDSSFMDDAFLKHWLPKELKTIEDRTSFATVKHLSVKSIYNIDMPIIPEILRARFMKRVALIEKQKQQAEASLVKAEELFSSLLQRAFKGELTS